MHVAGHSLGAEILGESFGIERWLVRQPSACILDLMPVQPRREAMNLLDFEGGARGRRQIGRDELRAVGQSKCGTPELVGRLANRLWGAAAEDQFLVCFHRVSTEREGRRLQPALTLCRYAMETDK